ncbi:hypothetical protein HMPREF9347_00874 [Escherichia coli MS 124-1]|uniref:Uncharacterized protein n=1 Tax=Escherichia coli MS 85-1 TaxID=679202 RepID=A0AAN3SFJ8_ECOLX|nr:hypothetical protein HMPREF9551_01274 [Escherichia coli MS 196-1]EFJ84390.1 hypothetical protein HMPREF9536_05377 [Escherichia coli MS 84-1]EFJ96919.1 hypothetical protein HMPREF9540_03018 [Escherichia coli MS 115-1]EFK00460.1 hypothetical protein HMPREF9548_04890 [Escherichia coli MS 182-1]EFK24645.1 hypothetical protein HMPREF9550_03300 [Escherichia coli MS 187-1]EFK45851.1 hypothetical protein HMPREF9346_02630 [Escherichia coli MS 119-7]EFK53336.1 hypothetical protein HMPREF9345_00400 [
MSQFQIFINNSPKTTLIQREYWFPLCSSDSFKQGFLLHS